MPKKILIVDDEPQMVMLLESALKNAGYEVETAFDTAQAAERLKTGGQDLVLLDFLLENSIGEDLLRDIRSREATKGLPVIIVTAFSSRGTQSFLAKGATDVMFKPLSLEDLLSRIRALTR